MTRLFMRIRKDLQVRPLAAMNLEGVSVRGLVKLAASLGPSVPGVLSRVPPPLDWAVCLVVSSGERPLSSLL